MSPTYIHGLKHPGSPQPPSQDLRLWAPVPFCECAWSIITHAQAAPYKPLILIQQENTPRSHMCLLQLWVLSCCAPYRCQSSGWRRLLTASHRESAPPGADRSHGPPGAISGSAKCCFDLTGDIWYHLSQQGLPPLLQIFMFLLQLNLPPFLKNASGVPSSLFNPANGHFKQTS